MADGFAVPGGRKKEGSTMDAAAKERLAVIATNGDATESKYCAVRAGYWDDPFIEFGWGKTKDCSPHARG